MEWSVTRRITIRIRRIRRWTNGNYSTCQFHTLEVSAMHAGITTFANPQGPQVKAEIKAAEIYM